MFTTPVLSCLSAMVVTCGPRSAPLYIYTHRTPGPLVLLCSILTSRNTRQDIRRLDGRGHAFLYFFISFERRVLNQTIGT